MGKKLTSIFLVLVLLLALVGCESKQGPEDTHTESQDGIELESVKIGEREVFNNFLEKYPDTKINKIGLELENKKYVYEIEAYTVDKEYEVKIDSTNGEILKEGVEDYDNQSGDIRLEDLDKVDKFLDKALKDGGSDYSLKEWKIKEDKKEKVIEIEIFNSKNQDIEYKYNIETEELIEKDM